MSDIRLHEALNIAIDRDSLRDVLPDNPFADVMFDLDKAWERVAELSFGGETLNMCVDSKFEELGERVAPMLEATD